MSNFGCMEERNCLKLWSKLYFAYATLMKDCGGSADEEEEKDEDEEEEVSDDEEKESRRSR